MRPCILLLVAMLGLLSPGPSVAARPAGPPPTPCGACLALVLSPAQVASLDRLDARLQGLRVLVSAEGPDDPRVAAAVATVRAHEGRAGILLAGFPTDPAASGAALAGVDLVFVDLSARHISAELGYAVRSLAAALRGEGIARLGVVLDRTQREQASRLGLAPYFDIVVLQDDAAGEPADALKALERWTVWPAGQPLDPVRALTRPSEQAAAGMLVRLAPGEETVIPALASLSASVPPGLASLPEVTVQCDVACDADSYLDAGSLAAVIIVRPSGPVSRISVRPGAAQVLALLPARAAHVAHPGESPPWRREAKGPDLALPSVAEPFVLRVEGWRGTGEEAFATGVEVRGSRALRVEEIVARHQAARARQASLIHTLISSGSTVLTFEAPGFAAPVTVTANTTIYESGGGTEVEQRDIRVNGLALATRGDQVPKLPLIEPERVTTPPLVIALTEAYRYRLEGREQVGSRPAYVVSFQPIQEDRSLFAGRAWIDARTFGLVRLDATQTALPGPVVTSRQVDEFEPVAAEGATMWLPVRSEINQRYESAGYTTPIHRVVSLTTRHINPPDFPARLQAAYRSDAVMLKDTPQGFRYLRRRGPPSDHQRHAPAQARDVAEDRSERVRTGAAGVTLDPNISVPLVFAGISYLDFNLFGTLAQLDGFFGGTYGRLAWAGPPFGRTRWRVSGDAFGIVVSYNERMFRDGLEQYRENVTQRPLHLSAGLAGPLPGAWRLRAAYEMDYTRYGRSDSTAPEFRVPPSTAVHGLRLTIERQRGPWVIAGWWSGSIRQRWSAWGLPTEPTPAIRTFQRFGLRGSRAFVWSPRAGGRIEGAWMDGRRLDRFSRYALGTFDNPLRGYPSASVRYDRGFLFRSSASWTPTSLLRLDAFADLAVARDPGRGPGQRGFPGVGAGLQVPAPFGVLAAVEWGYGFAGYNTDGSQGTQVIRISAYKVF